MQIIRGKNERKADANKMQFSPKRLQYGGNDGLLAEPHLFVGQS